MKNHNVTQAAELVLDSPGASFIVAWLNNVNNWERTKQKYIISFTKWPAARSNRKVTNIIN